MCLLRPRRDKAGNIEASKAAKNPISIQKVSFDNKYRTATPIDAAWRRDAGGIEAWAQPLAVAEAVKSQPQA